VRALVILFLAALVGCAGAPAQRAEAQAGAGTGAPGADRHAEVRALDGQIAGWRQTLHLAPSPDPKLVEQMHDQPPLPATTGARPAEVCVDVCELADHICRAQQDICRLADELTGDEWARGRCDSAKASCVEARKRCTECPPKSAAR
jgi:hypothetical protein